MEIHEIIRENGRVTKDEYRDITPEEAITKIAETLAAGKKIALRSNSLRDETISFFKGKGNMDEHFCLLFDNEDDVQEKMMAAIKSIKNIEYF